MEPPCSTPPNSSSNAISAQWQLNETAQSAISVAKGVLQAATKDNVQPIAILAAEAFGTTLAICQETQLKVEKEAKKHRPSYIVKFLQSSIGYTKDDSAYQLASTNSGVRFLGLAAVLICTKDNFTAARALSLMITSSSKQDQLYPTIPQLQELILAIEYKINRAGFAESVLGWETFIAEHPHVPDNLRAYSSLSTDHPSIVALQKLVDAFRDLNRLGNATYIHIRAGTCCPWIVAFVRWCLGVPPNIVLSDGTVLLDQPESKVTIFALVGPQAGSPPSRDGAFDRTSKEVNFEITTYQNLSEPKELWSTPAAENERWHGMVSIAAFGKRSLREYGLVGNRAVLEALPYTLTLVNRTLRCKSDDETNQTIPIEFTRHLASIFPKESHILATLANFLNVPDNHQGEIGEERQNIAELPLVAAHIRSLQQNCHCGECPGPQAVQWIQCRVAAFKESLARLTADVLAMSLFDCIEPMLLYLGHLKSPELTARQEFVLSIKEILFGVGQGSCSILDILRFSLSMAGHDISEQLNSGNWVASEMRGQVLYPQLFDTVFLNSHGMLRLGGGPGKLSHEGQSYTKVSGQPSKIRKTGFKPKRWNDEPVHHLKNMMPSEKIEWKVSAGDRMLHLLCGTTSIPMVFNPFTIVDAACRSLFITSCPHEATKPLAKPDLFCYFITPIYENKTLAPDLHLRRGIGPVQEIGVVPTFNNDGLRFFALAGGVIAVIRGPLVCLQCCLDICRQAGLQYVVL